MASTMPSDGHLSAEEMAEHALDEFIEGVGVDAESSFERCGDCGVPAFVFSDRDDLLAVAIGAVLLGFALSLAVDERT